jgi:type III secretion protein C
VIALLDVPTQLVEIEAMIVDISTDRAHELGVDWSGRVGKTTFSASAGLAAVTYTSASTAAANYLITQLRLLESKGDVEILSRPAVLTSDNLAAVLDLSETFFIKSSGERVANVTPVTTGITLRVTPHVIEQDGKKLVQLKIDIEDGQVGTAATVDALPTVTKSSVSTEATVMSGEALLIAGYTSNRNLASRSQVPVLGDVPGVGNLFANTTRNTQKRERMFLIRPKVVGLPGQATEVVTAPQW